MTPQPHRWATIWSGIKRYHRRAASRDGIWVGIDEYEVGYLFDPRTATEIAFFLTPKRFRTARYIPIGAPVRWTITRWERGPRGQRYRQSELITMVPATTFLVIARGGA